MNGLEKITAKIEEDNKIVCENILKNAEKKAEEIIEEAKKLSNQKAEIISADGKKEAQLILSMAESGAELSYKRKILAAKLEIINSVLEKTKDTLKNAGEAEYFDSLLRLAVSYADNGTGEMKLSQNDLNRMNVGFEEKLNDRLPDGKKIIVSREPAQIDGGFILSYEETEQNCTFDALIDDKADEIKDRLASVLFA